MDTYFLFMPAAWAEALQRSKVGRLFAKRKKKQPEMSNEDGGQKSKSLFSNLLFSYDDMPDYLQFNPWILSGYRAAHLTTAESLGSLLYVHNETVNILTHALPIVVVMTNFSFLFGSLPRCMFTYFHAIACLTPWMGSCAYHVLMNHRRGRHFYANLLRLDMSGIWFTQTFGALTTLSVSFAAFSDTFRHTVLVLYLVLSIYALYKGLTARNTFQRMSSFLVLVAIRMVGLVVRSYTTEPLECAHLLHVINQEALPILGAILSCFRLPERLWPGKFDIVFNSHNLMHCLVVAGGVHMHLAFRNEIQLAAAYNHF